MKAGREMDALVAERVMLRSMVKPQGFKYPIGLPCYSTDIVDAWKVVDKIANAKDGIMLDFDPFRASWKCTIETVHGRSHFYDAEASTAPEAICMAALKAVIAQPV